MKYENYLEQVQKANPDEFEEINTILNRYKLLVQANLNLENNSKSLEDRAEATKNRIDKYEKDKRQEILQLNNDNAKHMKRLEEIKIDIVELNSESEKVKSRKLKEMSELAQILMAINNLEQKCANRKYDKTYDGKSNRQSILKH